ncbi:dockerin type I repeat-containing protein [Candidatus Marinimicrobia bacterium]|jgi:hypothetical protein|nr:dockerin type I repeat-containing protein [Candidatus Neomarinimicrobiota bacterium]
MKHFNLVFIFFLVSFIKAEEIVIYATESAQYASNNCCTLNTITNQNGNELISKSCFETLGYGCGSSISVPFWIFDLSELEGNENIQSFQFKGNALGTWWNVYFSVSYSLGPLSTTVASELWNGGDWSFGDGQDSGFSWQGGEFSQNLSLDIILPGINSGQLNILAYESSYTSIDNLGDDAPRLVIQYEPEIVPILGDINNDNIVNILDIVEIVNLIFNNNQVYIDIADMNSDSKIDIFDLVYITELI